jgi:arabinogalactan endo-1,4-beta-galactosidase
MNTIRLRVFVNLLTIKSAGTATGGNGCYGFACSKMGMRVMIDFHYSDSWADPGKQFKPAAWKITLFQNY